MTEYNWVDRVRVLSTHALSCRNRQESRKSILIHSTSAPLLFCSSVPEDGTLLNSGQLVRDSLLADNPTHFLDFSEKGQEKAFPTAG